MSRAAYPVQRDAPGGGQLFVPWQVGVEAWEAYSRKYGNSQSAADIARRSGFGEAEMDEFRPGWREFIVSPAPSLRR